MLNVGVEQADKGQKRRYIYICMGHRPGPCLSDEKICLYMF